MAAMITFRDTLQVVEQLSESLRSTAELESTIRHSLSELKDLKTMLEASRVKKYEHIDELIEYIERVALSNLTGIMDHLEFGSEAQLKRLKSASAQASRLKLQLQMLNDGSGDSFLD
jgi:hypothetical protein